ncbi:MAG: MmgE/PrpD family protein [Desulfuromusa sp.]|nr:MmgE/PrpD family protein [Desulfuromusa sp.]
MIVKAEATTHILARFASELTIEDIPPVALEIAKRALLDLLAAAIAGRDTLSARAVTASAETFFAKGTASLWFSNKALTAPGAAYVNSTLASAQDLDDGHRQAMGHPGASIIPAAIAVAEETHASGIELLLAIIAGYEVAIRIAASRDLDPQETLASGKWCGFGAVAAAGRLRRMSADKLAEAMAIAGVQAPGLAAARYSRVSGNSVKEGIAWSTLTALCAMEPAERGFTGPIDILDNPDYYDREKIISGLGKTFAIEQIYFKPYSCCRWIHSAIDALIMILTEHDLPAEKITGIDVHLFERAFSLDNFPDPDSLEGAQYSIPFCLAVLAVVGKTALLPMQMDLLSRKDITTLARKIRLFEDTELTAQFPETVPARVIVHTKNDRHIKLVKHPEGDPANPMQWQAIEDKSRLLSQPYQDSFDVNKVIGAIKNIEGGTINDLKYALETGWFDPILDS